MTDEYPRMLFKDGTQYRVWNAHDVDTLIVADAEEEAQAKAEGWRESPAPPHPLDHDLDGKPGGSLPRRGRKPQEKINA
ncbi:hypothetical protein [Sphingobium sp. YC-XJ3]|uniref:hypothetical protein n=1 Tax=Sphingobium sp. YC-XJ3 TaxID=3024245 RepID=UPI002362D157|nr:hypothetical protein [Sphingobium sp. YC-XJ3]WDA36405.1 hypothetical protein PO876_23750 [Sphingobium sp. YC-XJ3]WDA37860.1 hypothetical protein PO876_06675 [Sphingobium sp. YC-XJ3]